MRTSAVVLASLWLALVASFAQAVALPRAALACSCAMPLPTLAEIVTQDPGLVTVVAGTIGLAQPQLTPVQVNAWFHGPRPADVVWLNGGTQMMSSCDVTMRAGEQRLLVLYGDGTTPYSHNMCSPGGTLDSPEGAAALAEALEVFGGGEPPPTEPPAAVVETTTEPGGDPLGWAWLLGGLLAAAALLGVVVLVARRRHLS